LKHCSKILILLMIVSTVCACASRRPIEPIKWEYEKEAIKLQIKADTDLNWHGGTSHTLHLCVYQLKDRNVFENLAGYEDGLRTLLNYSCNLRDDRVVKSESLFISPGEFKLLTMDRAEGAQHVAIAAGYEGFSKHRATRDKKIPVITETKGFIRRKEIKKPGHLNIEITLGKEQILTFKEIKGK
jgi:type VI secretion system VasD/TssJ family lipoprotein